MDKHNNNTIKLVLLSAVFLPLLIHFSAGNDEIQAPEMNPPFNIIDAAKRLYSLPTASDRDPESEPSIIQPPNLNFRGGHGGDDDEEATVSVKDAVKKSLDKSRATMEDSAKSAAEFVLDKTVNKLKTTASRQDHQTEL